MGSQFGMDLQMALLAVNGDEELGLAKGVDDLQFLLAGVTGDMQPLALFVNHLGTLAVKLINNTGYGFFVAGDGGGRNDDPVAGGT